MSRGVDSNRVHFIAWANRSAGESGALLLPDGSRDGQRFFVLVHEEDQPR